MIATDHASATVSLLDPLPPAVNPAALYGGGSFIRGLMNQHHYRDLIRRAVLSNDGHQLGLIVVQLTDAERAREILRAKGYGTTGMNASATAAQVPCVPRKNLLVPEC